MPRSGSIEQTAVSATATPESATDFFAGFEAMTRAEYRSVESSPVAHEVTLIPGDGTGPELTEATRRVLEATGVEFDWDVQDAGADVMDRYDGNPLPEHVLESIRRNRVAIKSPITTPI